MKSFPNQWSKKGKLLECGLIYNRCKDTLCSPESKISEWFPTVTQGRLRIKALDPYGNMRLSSQKGNIRKKDFLTEHQNVRIFIWFFHEVHP